MVTVVGSNLFSEHFSSPTASTIQDLISLSNEPTGLDLQERAAISGLIQGMHLRLYMAYAAIKASEVQKEEPSLVTQAKIGRPNWGACR
jgi:hypothetical protein